MPGRIVQFPRFNRHENLRGQPSEVEANLRLPAGACQGKARPGLAIMKMTTAMTEVQYAMWLDPRRYEIVDDQMADILRRKRACPRNGAEAGAWSSLIRCERSQASHTSGTRRRRG